LEGLLLINCFQKELAHLLDAQHAQMLTVFVFGMKDFVPPIPPIFFKMWGKQLRIFNVYDTA
jgi:hypothetical protein